MLLNKCLYKHGCCNLLLGRCGGTVALASVVHHKQDLVEQELSIG